MGSLPRGWSSSVSAPYTRSDGTVAVDVSLKLSPAAKARLYLKALGLQLSRPFRAVAGFIRRLQRAFALAFDSDKLNEAQLSQALAYGDRVMKDANLSRQRRKAIYRTAANRNEKLSDFVLDVVRQSVEEVV